ncbi:MAG: hypothetical protein WAN66_26935 [Limnoraphis robusta]|nr:hypothetical protein [Limnoraphis robusta]
MLGESRSGKSNLSLEKVLAILAERIGREIQVIKKATGSEIKIY